MDKYFPYIPFVGLVYLLEYSLSNNFQFPDHMDNQLKYVISSFIQASTIMIGVGLFL